MSRRKIANLERDLEIAESDYREQLIAALHRTAEGHWGLFGANSVMEAADRASAIELLALGERIQGIREQLGNTDPFDLHERFVMMRRECRMANGLGEPKLAQCFLADIEAETT